MSTFFVGKPIPLIAQIEAGAVGPFFVRATIKDPDGVEISASPQGLTNQGGGEFSDNTVLGLNVDFLSIRYEVFSDAGFTVPHPEFPTPGVACLGRKTDCASGGGNNLIAAIKSSGTLIARVVSSGLLEAKVSQSGDLVARITGEELKAKAIKSDKLIAETKTARLVAVLKDC